MMMNICMHCDIIIVRIGKRKIATQLVYTSSSTSNILVYILVCLLLDWLIEQQKKVEWSIIRSQLCYCIQTATSISAALTSTSNINTTTNTCSNACMQATTACHQCRAATSMKKLSKITR